MIPDKINKIIYNSGAYYIESKYIGDYTLEIDCKKLLAKYNYNSECYKNNIILKIKKKKLSEFINKLDELNVFSWKKDYSDENVCDGGYWSLKFKYNKNEIYEINGDNDYPENYEYFIETLAKYFPIIKLDYEYRKKLEK